MDENSPFLDLHEAVRTILRREQSIIGTVEAIARRVIPHFRIVAGFIINTNGDVTLMSGAQNITLTNAANPAAATRYLAVVDITNGTTLPTVTTSDTSKLVAVAASSLTPATGTTPAQFLVGFYPVDAAAETNDAVTGTISLPGQPDIVLDFTISGAPVPPPPETDTLDTASGVAAWTGAPSVPATPV